MLVVFASCQSTLIKNERYKVAPSSPELGSIGQSQSLLYLLNKFKERTLPQLENKIRVGVEVIPYNKRLYKLYAAKSKYNQQQAMINYVDSLPNKPEFIAIRLQDVGGMLNELNAPYNTSVFKLLEDTQKYRMVSAVAVSVSTNEIASIREADSYYLINTQDNKYDIVLFKSGKKMSNISINPESILVYQTSSFCWGMTDRGKWYIADMAEGGAGCKGKTYAKIQKKKKSKALFDM